MISCFAPISEAMDFACSMSNRPKPLTDERRLHEHRFELDLDPAQPLESVEPYDALSALEDEKAHVLCEQLLFTVGELRAATLDELRRVAPMRLGPQGEIAEQTRLVDARGAD